MSWLDDAITFISPEWGARRLAWRQSYEEMRSYDAGNNGRLNAGWRTVNQSAEDTDRWSRDQVRARARDLERNSDVMNSILGANKRNVIGKGFRLQAMTENEKMNDKIERLWQEWCKPQNCDVTGQQSFTQMLRMLVVRKKVDGGILIHKCWTDDPRFPFKLQLLEVDELDSGHDQMGRVVDGIEYNEWNRPIGYWIRQYTLDGVIEAQPKYIPAEEIIFYFTKRRPSQIREMSDMAHTLTRIRDLNEFITSVAVKQRVLACLSVFIKKALPPTIGRQAVNQNTQSYDGKSLTPGLIKELGTGDDVAVVNPTGQSADATSFTKLQQRMIAAGQGISYEATSRDMSETSYSSARQGLIEDELTFDEEYEHLAQVMDQIYEAFLHSLFVTGLLKNRGYYLEPERFYVHQWIRTPKAWIDPLKEASATQVAMASGIKTFKEVCAENGRDYKSVIDDMDEVNKYASAHGIDMEVLLHGKSSTAEEKPGETPGEPKGPGDDKGNDGRTDPDRG